MKNEFIIVMVIAITFVNKINADEIEEVIVTSSYIHQALNEIHNPMHLIDREDVSNLATQSLGESLDNLLGVSSSDYGAGV
ncbi:MAG: hypothetical protein VX469_03180, partial [Pseudomonadota bacterium]|nr:hypothetical protein [Pseudomonadota bacterium]